MIFKAALASQRRPSWPYKAPSFQTLRHPQFLSNFQSPKFKFSISGKKNVLLFDVKTQTAVLSEKNVLLLTKKFLALKKTVKNTSQIFFDFLLPFPCRSYNI